ncbi:TPA: Com family DNA-binding transcriptional regulator [Neisseria meningitidis]|nr:Com family DNA-binding transcriptional regulator [Neisseria lactamica]
MQIYREMRCKYCGRLLAKGSGSGQIKCMRCKNINTFN